MATFFLIHSSGQGPEGWKLVVGELERRGTITPAWQRKIAREWLGVEPTELPGGHAPNVSRPELLADVLNVAATPGSRLRGG